MLYVSRIKFRNFKSFRHADIELGKGYVCLAGPNGSGKSNVIDGLRFAFGELSLKSLRARKIHDLISIGSDKAEITVNLDGDRKHEIRRAIREDGKTLYKMDGRRVTRSAVIEALKPYGLDESGSNIIAQGQVQKFIEMNAKERRGIVEQVAGIADFEDKIAEAQKELGVVEQKVNDASIVLHEREGVLAQLEKEKDDALAYVAARDSIRVYKGSVVDSELKRVDVEHTEASEKYFSLKKKEEEARAASDALNAKISSLEEEKFAIVKEINEKAELTQSGLMREIGELKSAIAISESTVSGKNGDAGRIGERAQALDVERAKLSGKVKALSGDAKKREHELGELKKIVEAHESARRAALRGLEAAGEKVAGLRAELAELNGALDERREAASKTDVERASLESRMCMLQEALDRLGQDASARDESAEHEALRGEENSLKRELTEIEYSIEASFAKEKELNRKLPEVEKRFLEAKEKFVSLSSKLAAMRETQEMQAAGAILELRDRGMLPGVHGTAGELCKFPDDYATAVEVCAGNRLNYVIVDDTDTAAKAIEYLKQRKLGRCTFIPLDKKPFVFSAEARELSKKPGSEGFMLHHVEFDGRLAPAFEYVFGDTLLVDSVSSAKKIGAGRIRMVTFEGELFESSGVITGGTVSKKIGLREKAEAEKLRAEVDSLKAEKESVFSSLEAIREEMNGKRRKRGELEVKLKGIEIELKHAGESAEKEKEAAQRQRDEAEALRGQILECSTSCGALEKKTLSLNAGMEGIREKISFLADAISLAEKAGEQTMTGEADHEFTELMKKKSSAEAALSGLRAEIEVNSSRFMESEAEEKSLAAQRDALVREIASLTEERARAEKLLAQKEEKIKSVSGALNSLYEKRNALEGQIEEFARERGKRSHEFEKVIRQFTELEARKASLETRLADLKAEAASYADVKPVEMPRAELETRIAECSGVMAALGNVNLKAPEAFEEMGRSIGGVKERIMKLAEEKLAVVHMIEEIGTRKKEVFMGTFHKLNENFKNIYSHTLRGEATFVLEDPANPFGGGLSIRVRDEAGKEKYLESMSGGEKALLSVIFVFAVQMVKPAPFYVLDEADAALDKENSLKLANLLRELSKATQFIVVTHNDSVLSASDIALGVTKTQNGSRVVGIELKKGENRGEQAVLVEAQTAAAAKREG